MSFKIWKFIPAALLLPLCWMSIAVAAELNPEDEPIEDAPPVAVAPAVVAPNPQPLGNPVTPATSTPATSASTPAVADNTPFTITKS